MPNQKLVTLVLTSAIFVRGKMYKKDDKVEVNEREAKELISRGKAVDETDVEVDISFNEMTLDELSKVDYKTLNKEPLVEFAKACGLEITDETKKEIVALIETDVDFESEE